MGLVRRPWVWQNPANDKKLKIWHTKDMVNLLENVIEEEDQAESFFAEYEKVAPPGLAEHNLAYSIRLISDPDIREDAFDLFMINVQEFQDKDGAIKPHHTFYNKNGGSSLGLKVDASEIARSRKATKATRKAA